MVVSRVYIDLDPSCNFCFFGTQSKFSLVELSILDIHDTDRLDNPSHQFLDEPVYTLEFLAGFWDQFVVPQVDKSFKIFSNSFQAK